MVSRSLHELLDSALRALKAEYSYMPFDIATVREKMEQANESPLSDDEARKIRPMMMQRWGSGVEPAAIGGEVWKFGYGRPPVSQEIGGPR